MVHLVENSSRHNNSSCHQQQKKHFQHQKQQKEHLIFIDRIINRINKFDNLDHNVQINGYYYIDPVTREKIWIKSSKTNNLIDQFSSLNLNSQSTKLYIPEYDYEHDKPEDILKMKANNFDYERFVKEWQSPRLNITKNDSQNQNNTNNTKVSTLPPYYNQTITSLLNENQTKLIYNTENSNLNRINYKKYSNSDSINSKSGISNNSVTSGSNNSLKYIMYLATVVEDDQESSDKSLVVLNNTKLKQEIDSDLGIFSKTNKNNFNTFKIKKNLCEFIPGDENMPACDIEITITAEDLSSSASNTSSSQHESKSRTDDLSQNSSKSFIQEAKQILENLKHKHETTPNNLKSASSNSTLDISDLSDAKNSDDFNEPIYCEISDTGSGQSKQKRILKKANEKHKIKKRNRKKKSEDSSDEQPIVNKPRKKKKEIVIYANEPPVERIYDSLDDSKDTSEINLTQNEPVIHNLKNSNDLSNESQQLNDIDIKNEVLNDDLEKTEIPNDSSDEKTSVNKSQFVRQDSFLLNRILLINPDEQNKKEAQMFHTDKYMRNKILYEQTEAYLNEIKEKKRLLENNILNTATIYPIRESKSESIELEIDKNELLLKENLNNKSQIQEEKQVEKREVEEEEEEKNEDEEIEMKSDSETGEKVPANSGKRRSSTTSFVNYHFLSKHEKKMINKLNDDQQMETDEPSFLSKIPIIKELTGSRRSSNANPEISEEERRKLEESIHEDLKIKKEIINSDLNEGELNKKEEKLNLNPGQLSLLNKYRRESSTLPYYESFFPNPEKPTSRRGSSDSIADEKPPARVNNIVSGRRKSSEQIETLPKFDQNSRRRNSTAAFVNYHFLNKSDKSVINKKSDSSDYADTEDEVKSSILSKIPIIGSRIDSRRNSNSTQQEQEDLNARKRLEESIKNEIELKKELLKLDDAELVKKQEAENLNLTPSQRALLNKYRRESLTTLPYAESFFSSSPAKSPISSNTADPLNDNPSADTKSMSSLNPNQTVSARTMELHNKFKKDVTSPIDNETINLIEELQAQETADSAQPPIKHQRKSSFTNDSRLTLNDFESTKERSSMSVASSRNSTKSNVFKKLKTKLKKKFEK